MYSNYTKQELIKKLKKQRFIAVIHGIVILLLFAIAGFDSFTNGFSVSSLLPLCFIPMQIIIMLDVKKIKETITAKQINGNADRLDN